MKVICTRFKFATTVGIISGHPRYDNQTAQIIDAIKSQSKEPIEFVGVIGDQYSGKLSQTYASTSTLNFIDMTITRNYDQGMQENPLNPFKAHTYYKNAQLLKILKEKSFFENLHKKSSPALIIVGNYSLMKKAYPLLNEFYEQKKQQKPLRLAFDLMNAYRTIDSQYFMDYLYYNLGRQRDDINGYVFPSMCIGHQELFRAFQFLQKQRNESSTSFQSNQFTVQVARIVKKVRNDYRKSKGFTEDQYLTVLAPGNQDKQIKFSFERYAKSLNLFHKNQEIKGVVQGFFKTLILLPQDSRKAQLIKSYASSLSQVTFIQAKDKYAALCAADFAVLHNGQITVQAAACQLPAVVISNMSNFRAYASYLYNGHQSALNVATNFEGYQDLLGSWTVLPQKISSIMLDHFKRPKLRFYYTKLYRDQIQKELSMGGRNPTLDVSKTGIQAAAQDILNKINLRKQLNNTAPLNRYARKQKLELV